MVSLSVHYSQVFPSFFLLLLLLLLLLFLLFLLFFLLFFKYMGTRSHLIWYTYTDTNPCDICTLAQMNGCARKRAHTPHVHHCLYSRPTANLENTAAVAAQLETLDTGTYCMPLLLPCFGNCTAFWATYGDHLPTHPAVGMDLPFFFFFF